MNTFEKQEAQARQSVNWAAVFKVGLGLGLYLFIFSGGTPWTSGGVANGVLGRSFAWPWILLATAHFGLCLLYIAIVGSVIYRFNVIVAVIVGTLITLALYGVTFPILTTHNSDDSRAFFAHLVLGLFGSALYKAISVPKVRKEGRLEKA